MSMTETDTSKKSAAGDNNGKASATKVAAESQPSRSGSFMVFLALVISIAAVGVASWTSLQVLSLRELPAQISSDTTKVANLARRLDVLVANTERHEQALDDLASSLESGLSVVPELSTRIRQAEQQLSSMPEINAGDRARWLTTEALYYLQIANAQASLAGNARVAASALQLADDKLRDAADPALNPVRARLAEELAMLNALPVIDRTGISFRLQSLSSQAQDWPFRSTAPKSYAPDMTPAATAAEQGPWDRLVAILKGVLDSIISIKETDAPRVAQLGSAEEALIVEAVKAELQVARLSLVSGNSVLFSQSLDQVTEQINRYFDIDSAALAAALETLQELQQLELPGDLPDVSGALTLLLSISGNTLTQTGGDES
jgi:uroporphyrin-3 C-methyltransferase